MFLRALSVFAIQNSCHYTVLWPQMPSAFSRKENLISSTEGLIIPLNRLDEMDSSHELPTGNDGMSARLSSKAAGTLLQKPGLGALLGILLVSAWAGQAPIVMLTSLFLSAALLAKAWSHLSVKGVTCIRTMKDERFFPGEFTDVGIRVTNRKPLPLPWFQIEQELPLGISGDLPLKASTWPGHGLLHHEGALLWYRSMHWKFRLDCKRRGYYALGPMRFTSGDVFGFYSNSLRVDGLNRVIVYPTLYPVEKMGIPSLQPMGEHQIRRRIIQDPSRTAGLRDYRPGDSLRRIHWKASARSRRLQVRTFEATTSFKTALFLSVESFYGPNPLPEKDFELAISAAASIARHLLFHSSQVGVFVNTRCADSGHALSVPPAGSREQLPLLLEALAKVTPACGESFDPFLERERQHLAAGTTLVLLFGRPPESLSGLVPALKRSGYQVFVLVFGEHENPAMEDSIAWKHIKNAEDLRRI